MRKNWNRHIANIWLQILNTIKPDKKGLFLEIAPGEVNKIGLALSKYNFEGKLFIIEPNKNALKRIRKDYMKNLSCTVRPINKMLDSIINGLPENISCVLSNHPMDDFIVGKYLKSKDFDNFFDDHYDGDPEKTRSIWKKIGNKPKSLKKKRDLVFKEWCELIDKRKSEIVIISQYKSYFFKSNKIPFADKQAFLVVKMLRKRYKRFEISLDNIEGIHDKSRWLLLDFRRRTNFIVVTESKDLKREGK